MFRIPDYYNVDTLSFTEAVDIMTAHGRGDLLEGMQAMDRCWEEHCSGSPRFEDDDNFFDNWGYECSAYNVVFENMSKLFEKSA
jgi:hypothetical protein